MALINCPECGTEVSDRAATCVKCGCPISKPAGSPALSSPISGNSAAPVTVVVVKDFSLWQGFVTGWRKYMVCEGRARRREFWGWMLFFFIFTAGLSAISCLWLGAIFSLAAFIPNITITVRRLHDTGRSGWHLLGWWLIPGVVNIIVLCIMLWDVIGNFNVSSLESWEYALKSVDSYLGFLAFTSLCSTVGAIVLIVFCCLDSKPGANRFGSNPKGIEDEFSQEEWVGARSAPSYQAATARLATPENTDVNTSLNLDVDADIQNERLKKAAIVKKAAIGVAVVVVIVSTVIVVVKSKRDSIEQNDMMAAAHARIAAEKQTQASANNNYYRPTPTSQASSAPATTKSIDQRLVNAKGNAWNSTDIPRLLIFRADGSFIEKTMNEYEDEGGVVDGGTNVTNGTWFTDGNKITFSVNGGNTYTESYKINSNGALSIGRLQYQKGDEWF